MKSLFSRISSLNQLIIFCVLGVTTFSMPTMANPIADLQNEVAKRDISPEDVDKAMRAKFPESSFPYYAPPNGCSTPIPLPLNILFREVCNNHDICYTTPGRPKSVCDDKFLVEMSRMCESRISVLDTLCQTDSALIYYKAVDEFGNSNYDAAQSNQLSYIRGVYEWLNTLTFTRVFQTNSYISTGISVTSSDRIKIEASGSVRFGMFAGLGTPNGIIINPVYNYFPDVPHGFLMARFRQRGMGDLDGWHPIGVGWDELREVKLPSQGILEFLVNDNQPGNNLGAFRIEVTIDSSKK